MKTCFLILIIIFLRLSAMSQTPAISQPLPEWFRVHTFDDNSIIEINTNYVMFSNQKVERVRFRTLFQTLQALDQKSQVKYQSVLQEIQFDCEKRKYRLYAAQWLDAEGKVVASENKNESEEWQTIKFGSIIDKMLPQACKLIELRRREPAVEQ